jgi:hypothetical protein
VKPGITARDWDFEAPFHGLALTEDGATLCLAGRASDYAALIRTSDLSLIATVPVGDGPGWAEIADGGRTCRSKGNGAAAGWQRSEAHHADAPRGRCCCRRQSPMTQPWPYDLPIFRRTHQAPSPDGRIVAEIAEAREVSMGNPTRGTLTLSTGFRLDGCNPSFLWSSDSRFLAVPWFFNRWGVLRRQRMGLIDAASHRVFMSDETAHYFLPESFADGILIATKEPTRTKVKVQWVLREGLIGFSELHG